MPTSCSTQSRYNYCFTRLFDLSTCRHLPVSQLLSFSRCLAVDANPLSSILIFYPRQSLFNRRRRCLFHNVPFIFLLFNMFPFPSCQNTDDNTQEISGKPLCLHNLKFNDIIPTLTIVFFSSALRVRYLLESRRMHWTYSTAKTSKNDHWTLINFYSLDSDDEH